MAPQYTSPSSFVCLCFLNSTAPIENISYQDYEAKWCDEWSHHWFQYIIDHPHHPWNWTLLSKNPNLTWSLIQQYPDFPWNKEFVSANPNITPDIVQAHPQFGWNVYGLAKNPNFTWDRFQELLGYAPDTYSFSANPNCSLALVEQYLPTAPLHRWDWLFLSSLGVNSVEEIARRRYEFPWNWAGVSQNPTLSHDFVLRHLYEPWSWDIVSANQALEVDRMIEIQSQGMVMPWDWDRVCMNPTLRWDHFHKYPHLFTKKDGFLCGNSSLYSWNELEEAKQNNNRIQWDKVSANGMMGEKQRFLQQKRKEYYVRILKNIIEDKYNIPYTLRDIVIQYI